MPSWLITVFVRILSDIAQRISPEMRKVLAGFVSRLEEAAKKTPNPVDDILVDVLKSLLDFNSM